MSDNPRAVIGGNKPPVTAPTDIDLLDDLQTRYPEVKAEVEAFEAALSTYPAKIEDEAVAAALQDVLGKIAKQKNRFKADRGTEKKPWDSLTKVVQNFFGKAEEKLDGMLETWKPRHQAYLEAKAAEARRLQAEEAERQRQEAERLRKEAEEAAERRRLAEEAEALAREREAQARLKEEQARREQAEAEERARQAKVEAERIERENRDRAKAEKAEIADLFRAIKAAMKSAEIMHADEIAALDEDTQPSDVLNGLIMPGGEISRMGASLMRLSLDDDERADVLSRRARLDEMRKVWTDRLDAKDRRRREKERKAAEAAEAKQAAERAARRKADEAASEAARQARAKAEAEAAEAKQQAAAAKREVRDAKREGLDAYQEQKAAGKDAATLGDQADRTANRADRLDKKLDNSTEADLSRTRGNLGTVGGLARRWRHYITDEAALRAVSGPLGEHFTEEALNGAVYQWMRAHVSGFTGQRVEGQLAGVVFAYEQETRIA